VVRTEPEAGQEAAGGSEVKIFISKGNWKVVPGLIGLSEQAARELLTLQGFVDPEVLTQVTNNDAQVGKVISQVPEKDTERDPANPVTIVIGIAPAQPTTTPPTSEPPPTP
jgi:beta-lactam-binding protein with PASTA domain